MNMMRAMSDEPAFKIPQFAVAGPNHTFDPTRIAHLADNVTVIAMRFHKVGSSSFKNAISYVQPSHMDHDTLLVYRLGGLAGLRCLAAPAVPKVVFVTLFREPAARILSALYFYEGFTCGDRLDDSRRKRSAALNEELNFAHRWLRETPCAAYTAANVSRSMRGLAVANIGEELGGGMILDEYSHYFNVRRKADVAPTLALLRRSFLVGTTEDMPGADVGPTCLLPCSLTPIELLASPASLRSLCSFAPLLPCCSLAAPLLLPCCSPPTDRSRRTILAPAGLVDRILTLVPHGPARSKAAAMMRGELSARQKSGRSRSGGLGAPAEGSPAAHHTLVGQPQPQPPQPPPPDGRAIYCSARDVPKAVLADIAKLAGHDVDLYEGAKVIAAEQQRRFLHHGGRDGSERSGRTGPSAAAAADEAHASVVPVVEFNATYCSRGECRAGEGMRPGSYPAEDVDDPMAGHGRSSQRGAVLYRALLVAIILAVVLVLGLVLKHEFLGEEQDPAGQFSKLQQQWG